MTIASEITRLQWAKADIKTSIENKGVTVPSNAKLDTYDTYIDQINTAWAFMDNLALAWHFVTWLNVAPFICGHVSWNDSSAYYGAIIADLSWSSEEYYIICPKKQAGSDVQYPQAYISPWSSSIHAMPHNLWYYKKWNNIRIFFSEVSTYSSGYAFWFQADWDGTNTPTIVQIARNNNYLTLPPEADTTGYTEITSNSRIKSVSWNNSYDDAYIFITTK